jgi:hypothetical protein
MTDASGIGPADGTLIFGAPVAGNAFLTSFSQPTSEVVGAMTGDFNSPSADVPSDHRYIHSVGPITLKPGKSATIWVGVVSGGDLAAFFANADAANADIVRRLGDRDAGEGSHGGDVRSGKHERRSLLDPRCKRGCGRN